MIRAGLLALVLAGPAGAEGLAGQALCEAFWGKVTSALGTAGDLAAVEVVQDGDWCLIEKLVLDMAGQYVPDLHMDRLRFRGAALGWVADGSTLPEGLEVAVEGLRLVVQTGDARMDWLFAAQSGPNRIDADAALAWDPAAKVLRLEGLSVDFPGENAVLASAVLTGVDLSSDGAMQMSATGFALTEADLSVTSHGLFEAYALMALGSAVLPSEGDMDAAVAGLKADLKVFAGDLPGTSFSASSKAAMAAFIDEVPNPSGDLTLALRAEPGLGPVRAAGLAVYGVQEMLSDLEQIFQGVKVDIGWTHVDAP